MIHLHTHSHYSLLDGIIQISNLVARAKELNMPAIAITEHGNINSWVVFQRECNKHNIKPIFGIEAYCCTNTESKETYHITLLAKNNDGLREIIRLHNKATLEQFYRKPRMTYDQILECNNIIVLSGCMGSYLSKKLLDNDFDAADEWVNRFYSKFDNDFYIEIQDLDIEELDRLRERTKRYTDRVKRVVTNDVHYLYESDAEAHHLFMAGQFHKKANELKRTPSTMWLKPEIDGIDSKITYEIAEKCNAKIVKFEHTLPKTGLRVSDFLISERILDKEQLRKEHDVISDAGFMDYMCIVADYVQWARNNNIEIGTLRGSVGGSRLAYAMGIHDINPDDYGLYFSRFYNEGRRGAMPDIDTDFPQNGIEVVKEYLRSQYNLVGMATYGRMNVRGAIKFAGRVLDIPFQKMNEFSQKFGEYEINDIPLGNLSNEMQICLLYAKKYIGLFDKFGQHASGYIITDLNLESIVPLRRSNDGEIQTCWDMEDCESLGFIKFDLLKIKTLDIIQEAKRLANTDIELNDKKTFSLISSGNNLGVFQISGSDGINALAKEIRPQSLEDIGLILALYRPGPLSNNAHIEYVACRNGKKPAYPHPFLKPLLSDTYGLMVYQEQILKICIAIGFSETEADDIRKVMGKKKPELLADIEPDFIKKCSKITGEEIAKQLWNQMCEYAAYAFNKCLTGDAKLRRHSKTDRCDWDITLKEFFKIYHSKTATGEKYRDPKRGLWIEGTNADFSRTKKIRVKSICQNGIQNIYQITTKSGKSIKCTDKHKMAIYDLRKGWIWIYARSINIGDRLLTSNFIYEKHNSTGVYNVTDTKIPNGIRQNINTKGLMGFQFGDKNISYVNGQHILFIKNSEIKKKSGKCEICNKKPKRLEIHHIDGNRKNNDIINLKSLCVSCHKKEDYKLGRNKRGDKGYKLEWDEVVDIKMLEPEMTYDIEVDSEEHSFLANGIVTHNSHSIGYATLSYITAYLKANYPLAFYTALLNHTNDPSGIQDIINDMKPTQLLPPLYGKTAKEFTIEGDNIRYGLCGIYGIGEAEGAKILESGKDLLTKKSETTEMLIRAGYFDSVNSNRKVLLTSNYKNKNTRMALSTPDDYTPEEKEEFLFELLHVYLSESPLKRYDYRTYNGNNYTSGVRILATIKSITTRTSKQGNKYSIIETININNHIDKFFLVGKRYKSLDILKNKSYIITLETLGDAFQIADAKLIGENSGEI